MGNGCCRKVRTSVLTGNFVGQGLRGVRAVCFEELSKGRNRAEREQIRNTLYDWIDGERIELEEKYQARLEVENILNFMAFTNDVALFDDDHTRKLLHLSINTKYSDIVQNQVMNCGKCDGCKDPSPEVRCQVPTPAAREAKMYWAKFNHKDTGVKK